MADPAERQRRRQRAGSANYAKTGYFPNDTNYAEWIARAKELMTLWRSKGHPATGMTVDLEMRKDRLHQFATITSNGTPPAQVEAFLRQGMNPTRWEASRVAFRLYVDFAHSQGFKVAMTTLLPMIDDFVDDDADLRQAFGVPLENTPLTIQWDEISTSSGSRPSWRSVKMAHRPLGDAGW